MVTVNNLRKRTSVTIMLSIYIFTEFLPWNKRELYKNLPACLYDRLPACLLVCLLACLPACLPVYPACLPAYLPAILPACLPACLYKIFYYEQEHIHLYMNKGMTQFCLCICLRKLH